MIFKDDMTLDFGIFKTILISTLYIEKVHKMIVLKFLLMSFRDTRFIHFYKGLYVSQSF